MKKRDGFLAFCLLGLIVLFVWAYDSTAKVLEETRVAYEKLTSEIAIHTESVRRGVDNAMMTSASMSNHPGRDRRNGLYRDVSDYDQKSRIYQCEIKGLRGDLDWLVSHTNGNLAERTQVIFRLVGGQTFERLMIIEKSHPYLFRIRELEQK